MVELATALRHADALAALLAPACERIEIAGSVRRRRPQPHDIELVIIPGSGAEFYTLALELQMRGQLLIDAGHQRDGHRYKRRIFEGLPIDLFLVLPPAQWGLLLFIRTGPADFGHRALARWKRISGGGFSKDGCLHNANGTAVPTPEEADVFDALRLAWVAPEDRA